MRRLSAASSLVVPSLRRVALLVLFILCLAAVAPILRSQETASAHLTDAPSADPGKETAYARMFCGRASKESRSSCVSST